MLDDFYPDSQSPEEDRRQYDRSRLIIELHFQGTNATGVASTRDISSGGLYMNTVAVLPEGTSVMLCIPLSGGRVVINARVVYSNPGYGVGVYFDDVSPEVRAMIETAVNATRRLVA